MNTPSLVHLPSGQHVRALAIEQGDLGENYQFGINPIVTDLVVGQPKRRRMLGDQLFRTVPTKAISFQHKKFGNERFEVKETKRAFRGKFGHSDRRFDTVASKLERHGWATLADRDELANNQDPSLDMQAKYAMLAREIVELSLEKLRATVALAAASYSQAAPDLDTTLAGASEWNAAGGNSLTSIRASVNALCAQNGVSPDDIIVWLPDASYRAAQEDPVLIGRKANTSLGLSDVNTLREYWGVGGVVNADSYELNAALNGVVSMYGDVAVLTIRPRGAEFDLSEGELDSFCKFKWMQSLGAAGEPWYERGFTSWFFPWEDWELAASVALTAAAIIRNTAA